MSFSKKINLYSEDSARKILYLRSALILVSGVILLYVLYTALFTGAYKEFHPINLNSFNTGEWEDLNRIEPFNDGKSAFKAEILKDSTGEKFFRTKAVNDSGVYSGFTFYINRGLPANACLSLEWRALGHASFLIIDVMDGSVADSSGIESNKVVLGETFFLETPAPENKWSTFSFSLDSLTLNPYQPSGRTLNGVFDYSNIRQVSVTICPDSDIALDIRDLHFYWMIEKWPAALVLFIISLAGILLIFRTRPDNLFSKRGTAFNINALIPRILFCLTGLSAFISALLDVRHFSEPVNLTLFALMLVMILTDEFLIFLKPNPLWSLRYAALLFTGYLMGFSGGILPLSIVLLGCYMPLIIEKIKELFWVTVIAALTGYILNAHPDGHVSFAAGIILVLISSSIAVIIRGYLQQQEKDFALSYAIMQYEALFKDTSDAIFVLNENCEIVTVNHSFESLTGYQLNSLKGKNIRLFVSPESKNGIESMLEVSGTAGSRQYDIYFANRNGRVRTALVRCSAIYKNGKLSGYQALATDITERRITEKKLEESVGLLEVKANELAELNEQLNESNASKDKFFSIISHDLKNPFNSLLGFSDLLVSDCTKMEQEEIKMFAANINGAIKNVYNLLNNLLQWASIQSGKMKYNFCSIKLFELAEDALGVLKPAASAKCIRIINEIERDLLVYADLYSVNCVIQNLVTNAVKFTHAGGLVILSSSRTGKMAEVTVRDTGVGMTAEQTEKLFRIDVQHSSKGTANENGTGLGLLLCKELIEHNGGTICVKSEDGRGSSFVFMLPQGE